MPPNNLIQQEQWLDITDFSPGIYSHTNTNAPSSDRLLPVPPTSPGSADAAGTYACLCLPNGGLGALAAMTENYYPIGAETYTRFIVGLLVHDELSDGTTEAIIIIQGDDGTDQYWEAFSYILESNTLNAIVSQTNASEAGLFGSPYPQFTRVNLTEVDSVTLNDSADISVSSGGFPDVNVGDYVYVISGTGTIPTDTTILSISGDDAVLSQDATAGTATLGFTSISTPGNPVCVFPGPSAPMSGDIGQVYLYPDPSNPTAFGAFELIIDGSSISGQVVVHQNRIIVLSGVTYDYPAGSGFDTNEQICFTDPPNSAALGFQQTVLVPEEPYGYGCAGSISAGELVLIKKRGGGVVVIGDIFSPNVTDLPGVEPTGGIYGNASSGLDGFFYCSYENGAWVWNGGNTSVKVSPQLDDSFFLPPEFDTIESNNYGFYCQCIGDKVYFSNNYMYDTRTNSWWKYYQDDSQGGVSLFWMQPVSGRYLYAAPLSITESQTKNIFRFDMETPAATYQWRSLPLRLSSEDRVIDIREIVVRASCSVLNVSTVTVEVFDKGVSVWGPETQSGHVSYGPDIIRFNVGALGVTSPQVQVKVHTTGSDNAVIHAISLAYKPRAHQATTN